LRQAAPATFIICFIFIFFVAFSDIFFDFSGKKVIKTACHINYFFVFLYLKISVLSSFLPVGSQKR
jgi:hypothetical protein